jgi:hypothetical protein
VHVLNSRAFFSKWDFKKQRSVRLGPRPSPGLLIREEALQISTMLTELYEGLDLHVHGLPKFMRHMNPDKMSTSQRNVIVSFSPRLIAVLVVPS